MLHNVSAAMKRKYRVPSKTKTFVGVKAKDPIPVKVESSYFAGLTVDRMVSWFCSHRVAPDANVQG
jgi:hypothetical protein